MALLKKLSLFLITVLFSLNCFGDWVDIYKKGKIVLKPDPAFGQKTDWGDMFFRLFHSILVAPDGSVFISDNRKHRVLKFDTRGDLVKSFGQRGEGPGDLYYPKCKSLCNNELMISEYASRKRISFFDTKGNFVKIIKTRRPVFNPIQLNEKKIMYYFHKYGPNDSRAVTKVKVTLVAKDIISGKESVVDSYSFTRHSLPWGPTGVMSYNNVKGEPIFRKTNNGNIISGFTDSNELKILSPEGKLIKIMKLNTDPVPVTKEYIEEVRSRAIKRTEKNSSSQRAKPTLKALRSKYFPELFGKFHPLYSDIKTDSDGNILVFINDLSFDSKDLKFHVYSPGGDFICECKIEKNGINFNVDERINNIAFSEHGLFCFAGLPDPEDDEEQQERLIKIILKTL